MKDFLNRFRAFVVKFHTQDEALLVHAFKQGVMAGPFIDSLIRNGARTYGEIKQRAIAHIAYKEAMTMMRGNTGAGHAQPYESNRTQPLRVHETATEKKSIARRMPYESKKNQPKSRSKDDLPFRPRFKLSYKELLVLPGIQEKLRPPPKTDKVLGPSNNTWCDFRKAYGHDVENCITLGYQLAGLLKDGLLQEYLLGG